MSSIGLPVTYFAEALEIDRAARASKEDEESNADELYTQREAV
jgi:hypothetical protein